MDSVVIWPLRAAMTPPPPGGARRLAAPPMAPPPPPVASGGGAGSGSPQRREQELEMLRVLRVEVQKIQSQLAEVEAGADMADVRGPLLKNVDDAKRLMRRVSPNVEWGRQMHNAWDDFFASKLLNEPKELPAEKWPSELARLDALLTQMVETIGSQTVPPRMDEWLERMPHGFYFSFHAAFADELPRKAARDAMLRDLATTNRMRKKPKPSRSADDLPLRAALGAMLRDLVTRKKAERKPREKGLVDAATGLVYRRWERKWANAFVIALILGGFAGTTHALGRYGEGAAKAIGIEASGGTLVTLYVGVLLGSVLHMIVGASKRARREGAPPNMSPSYMVVWFACRFGLWAWTWALSLFVLAGSLKFLGTEGLTFWTAILAGYSLDSVAETFGNTLEKKAFDNTEKIKKHVGSATASTNSP